MSEHQGIWLSQCEKTFSDNCMPAPILLPTEPRQSGSNGGCTDSHVGPSMFLQTICSIESLCFAKLHPPSEVQRELERGSVFSAVGNRQREKRNVRIALQNYNANLPQKCVLYFWMCSSWTLGKITTKWTIMAHWWILCPICWCSKKGSRLLYPESFSLLKNQNPS